MGVAFDIATLWLGGWDVLANEATFRWSTAALCVADGEGRISAVNPAFKLRFGEPSPKTIASLFVSGDGSADARVALQSLTDGTESTVFQGVCAIGASSRKLSWRCCKVGDEILAEVDELDAEVTATMELDALLRALPDIYFRLDDQGRIVAFHSARETELHVAPELLIGRRAQDLVPPEVAPIIASAVERVLGQREPGRIEYTLPTPSGDDRFEAHLVPCGDTGVTVIIRNTTARLRAEAALRVSEERLLATQKLDAIGQLAGGIAHDFNNVLGVMLGRLGFLKRAKGLSPAELDHVDEALDAASHGAALTRQLMSFARKQPAKRTRFELNEVLEARRDMLRRMLGEDIELTLALDAVSSNILSDPLQIEQVLFNLVLNARQAMPKGGKLHVATSLSFPPDTSTEARPRVILTVTDTGSGMTPDVLAHLFEPFFTTKSRDQGTGIGLATVQAIVKQSGGHVVVRSEVGRGSTFEVAFPLAEDDETKPHARPR